MKRLLLRYPLLPAVLYFPVYLLWFCVLEEYAVPEIWLSTAFDRAIPFCSLFIIPYVMWFFFIAGVILWFACVSPSECLRLSTFLFVGMTICLIIYTVFPNGQSLRPTVMPDHSPLTQFVFSLYRTDSPTNVCPSIHVFATLGVMNALLRTPRLLRYNGVKFTALVLSVLIILSTMFLKQHSVIDVIAAFLLAKVMDGFVYKPLSGRTPAHSAIAPWS